MSAAGRNERVENRQEGGSRRAHVEEEVLRVAGRQHRQITRDQLIEAGLGPDAIDYRADHHRLHPVFAEVYSLGGGPLTQKEIWMAATLTFGPGADLAANAAVNLFGWLQYPLPGLYVMTPTRRKPRDGIVPLHRTRPGASGSIDGIPVTGPEQTILDCATTVGSDKAFRRIVRQAQAEDHTTHARLVAFAAMNKGARGVARLRRELADGPSRTRSANEDRVLEIFRSGEVPIPNFKFADDLEADLYFPGLGVVVEVGSKFHDNPTAQADDDRKDERYRALGLTPYRLRESERARRKPP